MPSEISFLVAVIINIGLMHGIHAAMTSRLGNTGRALLRNRNFQSLVASAVARREARVSSRPSTLANRSLMTQRPVPPKKITNVGGAHNQQEAALASYRSLARSYASRDSVARVPAATNSSSSWWQSIRDWSAGIAAAAVALFSSPTAEGELNTSTLSREEESAQLLGAIRDASAGAGSAASFKEKLRKFIAFVDQHVNDKAFAKKMGSDLNELLIEAFIAKDRIPDLYSLLYYDIPKYLPAPLKLNELFKVLAHKVIEQKSYSSEKGYDTLEVLAEGNRIALPQSFLYVVEKMASQKVNSHDRYLLQAIVSDTSSLNKADFSEVIRKGRVIAQSSGNEPLVELLNKLEAEALIMQSRAVQ